MCSHFQNFQTYPPVHLYVCKHPQPQLGAVRALYAWEIVRIIASIVSYRSPHWFFKLGVHASHDVELGCFAAVALTVAVSVTLDVLARVPSVRVADLQCLA